MFEGSLEGLLHFFSSWGEISTATPLTLFEGALKIKVSGEKNWKWD